MDLKQKTLRIVFGSLLVFAVMAVVCLVAGLAFMKSATQVVADIPSPDSKWDAMLMVRNGGTVTDYSTQVSIVPAASPASRGESPSFARGTFSSQTAIMVPSR